MCSWQLAREGIPCDLNYIPASRVYASRAATVGSGQQPFVTRSNDNFRIRKKQIWCSDPGKVFDFELLLTPVDRF
jgi:hypothetical protein